MLSFFQMLNLVETAQNFREAEEEKPFAVRWGEKHPEAWAVLNRASREKLFDFYYNDDVTKEERRAIEYVWGMRGYDPNELRSHGKSKNTQDYGRHLDFRPDKNYWNPGVETERREREPRAMTGTAVKLAKMRDKGYAGAEDARYIFHIISNNVDLFKNQAFTPQDFFLTLKRLGYREHGVERTLDPAHFLDALKILAKGVTPPIIQISRDNDKNVPLITVTPNNPHESDKAVQQASKLTKPAGAKLFDPREGDYVPDMAHPGEKFVPLKNRIKATRLKAGEMPPALEHAYQEVKKVYNWLKNEVGTAKQVGFADQDEVMTQVEQAWKMFDALLNSPGTPPDVKQEVETMYNDMDQDLRELNPYFGRPNPLKEARTKMVAARSALDRAEKSGEPATEFKQPVEAALQDAENALKAVSKSSAFNNVNLRQRIQQWMQELVQLDKDWLGKLNKAAEQAKAAAGMKPALPVATKPQAMPPAPQSNDLRSAVAADQETARKSRFSRKRG